MKIKQLVAMLLGGLLLLFSLTAFAETSLPDGAVKGLPERLAALDDEGNPVNSETGEYFFHVENMEFGETYTKSIQLINLREDYTYHIHFYVEPLTKEGIIDLELGCECRFLLDGEEFYKGTVFGDGNIDLTTDHFDCGSYAPGESHTLKAEITWNNFDTTATVDNGWRLVDYEGEHVILDPDGNAHATGMVEFKWIFYSQIEQEKPDGKETPDEGKKEYAPQTGLTLRNGTFWLICIGVITLAVVVLIVLIVRNKKKDKDKDQ